MSNSVTFILLILISCISLVGSAIATDCPVGDLYLDCKIDIQDLRLFAQQWLDISCSGPSCADLTGGGDGVNAADFAVLAEHWGEVRYRLVINEFMADNKGTIEIISF